MATKMDDFLSKKRESGPILDLSKVQIGSKDEFRKLLDKVPDFKVKAEKPRPEEVRLRNKHFRFRTSKKDTRKPTFTFADPVPVEMRKLNLRELASLPIDWKMLTTVRPKNQLDDQYYSRLIELSKLEQKTELKDKRRFAKDNQIRKMKNKSGILEMRAINCKECGEDFCTGSACVLTSYDQFARVAPSSESAPTKTVNLKSTSKIPTIAAKSKAGSGGKKKRRKTTKPKQGTRKSAGRKKTTETN